LCQFLYQQCVILVEKMLALFICYFTSLKKESLANLCPKTQCVKTRVIERVASTYRYVYKVSST